MGFFVCARYDREEDFQRTFPASCKVSYDFIADVDLREDRYKMVSVNERSSSIPFEEGSFIEEARASLYKEVLPKDLQLCQAFWTTDILPVGCRKRIPILSIIR